MRLARPLALLCATVATLATVATAAPAHADSETVSDPRGDAQRDTFSAESSADVVRTVGRHAGGRVTITITVANLTAGDVGGATKLVTNNGTYRAFVARFDSRTQTDLAAEDSSEIPCRGLSGKLDNAKDTIRVSVPRSCLDDPRSVRFGAGVFSITDNGAWLDDARRRGGAAQNNDLKVGQKQLRHN